MKNMKLKIDKTKMNNLFKRLKIRQEIKRKRIKNIHKRGNFNQILKASIEKYSSDKYKNKCHKKGITPPEKLYWTLYEYAAKYGRSCDNHEWKKYANDFTTDLVHINGYYFARVDGQGSFIQITKSND